MVHRKAPEQGLAIHGTDLLPWAKKMINTDVRVNERYSKGTYFQTVPGKQKGSFILIFHSHASYVKHLFYQFRCLSLRHYKKRNPSPLCPIFDLSMSGAHSGKISAHLMTNDTMKNNTLVFRDFFSSVTKNLVRIQFSRQNIFQFQKLASNIHPSNTKIVLRWDIFADRSRQKKCMYFELMPKI